MSESKSRRKLAILMSFSGAGGVEKMMINLIREFSATEGIDLELILIRSAGPYLDMIPRNVTVHKLRAGHSFTAVPELAAYLKKSRPDALLAAKDRAGRAAVRARSLAGLSFPITLRLGTNLSASLVHRSSLSRWLRLSAIPRIYKKIDHVVGNSAGVANDIREIAKLPASKVGVIRNPVVTGTMLKMAQASVPHPWLEESTPTILAMGRLTVQKDFATLIKAFALVRSQLFVRLIILGEGSQREKLTALIDDLGLENDVLMPGHQDNPYAWLSRADLFVLSSRWEGSPNALTEAFALGLPCVSTDCPSGPSEILDEGKYGKLVGVGNVEQLSHAISDSLSMNNDIEGRDLLLNDYRAEVSADNYLRTIFS